MGEEAEVENTFYSSLNALKDNFAVGIAFSNTVFHGQLSLVACCRAAEERTKRDGEISERTFSNNEPNLASVGLCWHGWWSKEQYQFNLSLSLWFCSTLDSYLRRGIVAIIMLFSATTTPLWTDGWYGGSCSSSVPVI